LLLWLVVINRIDKMRVSKNNVNILTSTLSVCPSFHLLSVLTLSVSLILLLSFPMQHIALAQSQSQLQTQEQQHSPNILASNIYQTQTIVLGKNNNNINSK
jgi:hypothetical protein